MLKFLQKKLKVTHDSLIGKISSLFRKSAVEGSNPLEELEEILITADVGVETTLDICNKLQEVCAADKSILRDPERLEQLMKEVVGEEMKGCSSSLKIATEKPTIYLIVGVNGVGKTTSIGKLAYKFKQEGKKVLLVAADTFRAAAQEQLEIWAQRAGVDLIRGREGSDPAAVTFDALQAAKSRNTDMVLIDTAGRLHTRKNLMEELSKVRRIIARECPGAPHETLLVLDASTGQNGLSQARIFTEALELTGIILTKLDGTAKGGVTIAVYSELGIPVKLIGLGEKIEDLQIFNPDEFLEALFADINNNEKVEIPE